MKLLTRLFFRGLATVLPLALTVGILYWLIVSAETLLRELYIWIVPNGERYYLPGLGFAITVVLIITVGALMYSWLARSLYDLGISLVERLPGVRTVYGMVKDILRFFIASETEAFDQVVMVDLPGTGGRILGFQTRDSLDDLPEGIGGPQDVAVYLPMSYQIGGFLLMVPRDRVQPVQMSMEEALRFTVTAGVATLPKSREVQPRP